MRVPRQGAIDCDVHIAPPATTALLPFLDEYWREQLLNRGLDRTDFTLTSYPPRLPLSGRPDWRPAEGQPGSSLEMLRREALDGFGSRFAIATVLHGAQALHTEDMAAALCRAVNDWVAAEWLDREPRLRGSIVVPAQNIELAVEEIERKAADPRFVQVQLLAMMDQPLGRRMYWPIYRAAEKHGLAVCIHAGSLYRHAPTATGWTSFHLEDYVGQAQAFDAQLASLVCEGVFTKFPTLKVVLAESGFTWLPTFLWRMNKIWRGLRAEVPWVQRQPSEIIAENVRVTLQPVDAPADPSVLARTIEHIGSDRMLLFASDFPHWHFDGDEVLPDGLPEALLQRILVDNPLDAYRRLPRPAAAEAATLQTEESAR
ncbi:amidohydrolase family protein [Roseomonas sp. BN140053]|uniref:amidohydrolase family protein n=1 Tax=Roseomonas sp. BN140053 TaxID=3391898 RepID=UPI0039EBB08B